MVDTASTPFLQVLEAFCAGGVKGNEKRAVAFNRASTKEGVFGFAPMFVAWAALSAAERGYDLLQCSCNVFFY
jgi:hypothetical protein